MTPATARRELAEVDELLTCGDLDTLVARHAASLPLRIAAELMRRHRGPAPRPRLRQEASTRG